MSVVFVWTDFSRIQPPPVSQLSVVDEALRNALLCVTSASVVVAVTFVHVLVSL